MNDVVTLEQKNSQSSVFVKIRCDQCYGQTLRINGHSIDFQFDCWYWHILCILWFFLPMALVSKRAMKRENGSKYRRISVHLHFFYLLVVFFFFCFWLFFASSSWHKKKFAFFLLSSALVTFEFRSILISFEANVFKMFQRFDRSNDQRQTWSSSFFLSLFLKIQFHWFSVRLSNDSRFVRRLRSPEKIESLSTIFRFSSTSWRSFHTRTNRIDQRNINVSFIENQKSRKSSLIHFWVLKRSNDSSKWFLNIDHFFT